MEGEEIKIVVPTKGRAKTMTTHKHINRAIICCSKEELPEYKHYHPDLEFHAHPDNIVGIAAKRTWIMKTFGSVFMMDDDIKGMSRLTNKRGEPSKIDPETAYWLVQNCGNVARLAGCFLFGFNTYVTPLSYIGTQPYNTRGFVNGCGMGILKGALKLRFNENIKVNNDIYLVGINAHFYRKAWIDARFCINQDGFGNQVGGNAGVRTREAERADLEELIKCFGPAIKVPPPGKKDVKHEFYKKLIIPY